MRRQVTSFHAHLGSQQDDDFDRIEIWQHGVYRRFKLQCDSRAASVAERFFDGCARFAFTVLDMHGEQVRSGIEKLTGELRRTLGHQVDVKGNLGVRADGANQVGEEEQSRDEVTVGRIQMEGIGPGREAAYGRFEIAEIRRPERYVCQEAITGQLGPAGHMLSVAVSLIALAAELSGSKTPPPSKSNGKQRAPKQTQRSNHR